MKILYVAKNGLHAFGYNSTENKPIWMKSGTEWAKCWGLALTYFWHDPNSSENLRKSRNFVFCPVNNAWFRRFLVGKVLHFNTTMSISEAVKTFWTEFWKFYHKESFFQKKEKLLMKFSGLATWSRHKSAMITDAGNSFTNGPSTECLVFIFTVTITTKSFLGMYAVHQKGTYSNFWQRPMSDIAY